MDSFDADPSTQTVEYKPVGVKDLLIAMKDTSELIVDLSYSALLNNSDNLAEEVLQLESRMDVLQMQARMNMLMAARKPEEARLLAPVLGIIGAAEKISEAAGDVANVVLEEEDLPGAIRAALPEAMEVLARAPVAADSRYAGRTLGGIEGAEPNVSGVYETVTGDPYQSPDEVDHEMSDLTRAVDTIVLMKNVSELSVDLAYASVLFDDEALAEEVHALEIEVDALQSRLEAWTLRAASEVNEPVSLRGLLHLANSTELISDAALEITEGILRDIDTHPVIAESVRESDVAVRRVRVDPESGFDDEPLSTLLDAHPGIAVIAIHRPDDEWVFYPDEETTLSPADGLIVRGTWEATEKLLADAAIS
ncbi:potassium channel protein [Halobacteriales archaeon QH_7_66_37]|nr:MAG: potassium channel protein [Halobacteriales archaeon QH_7_66_37]